MVLKLAEDDLRILLDALNHTHKEICTLPEMEEETEKLRSVLAEIESVVGSDDKRVLYLSGQDVFFSPRAVLDASSDKVVRWKDGEWDEPSVLIVDIAWFEKLWEHLTFNPVTGTSKPLPATISMPGTRVPLTIDAQQWKPSGGEPTPPYEPSTLGPWFCECKKTTQLAGWIQECPNCGTPGPQHGRLRLGRNMHSMDCTHGAHDKCQGYRAGIGSDPCACACHAINAHNRNMVIM